MARSFSFIKHKKDLLLVSHRRENFEDKFDFFRSWDGNCIFLPNIKLILLYSRPVWQIIVKNCLQFLTNISNMAY